MLLVLKLTNIVSIFAIRVVSGGFIATGFIRSIVEQLAFANATMFNGGFSTSLLAASALFLPGICSAAAFEAPEPVAIRATSTNRTGIAPVRQASPFLQSYAANLQEPLQHACHATNVNEEKVTQFLTDICNNLIVRCLDYGWLGRPLGLCH